jgi:hypothetical protein
MQDAMARVERYYPGHRVEVVDGRPTPTFGQPKYVRVYNADGLRVAALFVPEKAVAEHWWEDE